MKQTIIRLFRGAQFLGLSFVCEAANRSLPREKVLHLRAMTYKMKADPCRERYADSWKIYAFPREQYLCI